MPSTPYTGISPYQAMLDMADRIETIDDAATRGRAVIELSKAILAAQSQQAALVEEKRQLEEKIRSFETWEAEKKRYQLRELPPGVFVFELIELLRQPGEPPHQICQNCYQQGRKSVLHRDAHNNGVQNLSCDGCGKKWQIGHFNPPRTIRSGGSGPLDEGGPLGWLGR